MTCRPAGEVMTSSRVRSVIGAAELRRTPPRNCWLRSPPILPVRGATARPNLPNEGLELVGSLSIWHLLITLVVLLITAGVIALIVMLVKAGSNRGPAYLPPAAMPPGWYPDHADPSRLRWFDGFMWTDQVRSR